MKALNRNFAACFMGFALLSVFNMNHAFAIDKGGIFLEPMLTYETGKDGSINYPSPVNSSESDVNGFGAGVRLGLHIFESAFIGVDGRYSMPKFDDTSLNQDTDAKSWNYGPMIGLQMPFLVGLRAWAGWVLGGELDPDRDQGVDQNFKSAGGWRIGAGLKVAFASLNLEYQSITYDETDINQVGVFATDFSTDNIEFENKSWVLSVSFPMAM